MCQSANSGKAVNLYFQSLMLFLSVVVVILYVNKSGDENDRQTLRMLCDSLSCCEIENMKLVTLFRMLSIYTYAACKYHSFSLTRLHLRTASSLLCSSSVKSNQIYFGAQNMKETKQMINNK